MPPLKFMKMTRLALAGKCGAFGTSSSAVSARHCCRMAGSSAEPATMERIIWRRVGSKLENLDTIAIPSVHKKEFVAGKQHVQITGQRRARLALGGEAVFQC